MNSIVATLDQLYFLPLSYNSPIMCSLITFKSTGVVEMLIFYSVQLVPCATYLGGGNLGCTFVQSVKTPLKSSRWDEDKTCRTQRYISERKRTVPPFGDEQVHIENNAILEYRGLCSKYGNN